MFEEADANAAEMEAMTAAGAFIMGAQHVRPGPTRPGRALEGWWGEEPPYHARVFVLTHHARAPVMMKGGTTFTFVTDGAEAALTQAREAAGDANIAIAGGAATVNQFLAAGLIDELRLHVAPVLLGAGEQLFEGVGRVSLEHLGGRHISLVTHLSYRVHSAERPS